VDRLVNERGYVPGNITVMSFKANRIKNDSTAEELEAVARYVRSLHDRVDQETHDDGAAPSHPEHGPPQV
jgi:hypothetical protein